MTLHHGRLPLSSLTFQPPNQVDVEYHQPPSELLRERGSAERGETRLTVAIYSPATTQSAVLIGEDIHNTTPFDPVAACHLTK